MFLHLDINIDFMHEICPIYVVVNGYCVPDLCTELNYLAWLSPFSCWNPRSGLARFTSLQQFHFPKSEVLDLTVMEFTEMAIGLFRCYFAYWVNLSFWNFFTLNVALDQFGVQPIDFRPISFNRVTFIVLACRPPSPCTGLLCMILTCTLSFSTLTYVGCLGHIRLLWLREMESA